MGENTAIEWTDKTINFFLGCSKVSPGCKNCYMFRNLAYTRFNPAVVTEINKVNIEKKLKSWNSSIIFTNSMSDTFHESLSMDQIKAQFDIMQKYPQHEFIILTKRINKAFVYSRKNKIPANCWIGTSVEDRAHLFRINTLKRIDAKIRFVSFEPLLESLGQIDLHGIHWAIVGGESDFKAPRFFDPKWGQEILSQCRDSGTAYFFKQTGGNRKIEGHWGSDKLDGIEYKEMPIELRHKKSTKPKGLDAFT